MRIKLKLGFQKSLYKRLVFLVVIFTIALVSIIWYQFNYSHTTQDSILDAHETYYYSKMVAHWGNPPDTSHVLKEINNLQMWCGIFKREITDFGIAYPGQIYLSNLPSNIHTEDFYHWQTSSEFEDMYGIEIPMKVYFGEINSLPVTVVDNGNYLFYLVIDYVPPSEIKNLIFAFILSTLFIVILYFFISLYLKPVQLMKNRIKALENGDMQSKIDIIGEDELAELSQSMNQLIEDINILLENKHQLLLEVSHELRSPLARMQLLIAMIPQHKNIEKLKEEVNILEGMISNLLLSDRLSLPYSKLDLNKFSIQEIIEKVINMFPTKHHRIKINNHIPKEKIFVDEMKFTLALRNLLDNALKYAPDNKKININIVKNKDIEFQVKDAGIGVSMENIHKLTKPFYQADQTVSTKGFGLGLTICKKIIESHKGKLIIESKKGEGSCFILHLPYKN